MKNKLILLRHGESIWNLENRFTGWADVDLTKNGEKEAKNAGADISEMPNVQAYIDRLLKRPSLEKARSL